MSRSTDTSRTGVPPGPRAASLACFLLVVSCAASALVAQELPRLEYDEGRQVFLLSYQDDDGRARTVEIVGANRVRPEVSVAVRPEGASFAYAYEVRNREDPGSSQPIGILEMGCPGARGAGAPGRWSARLVRSETFGGRTCHFAVQEEAAAIRPGSRLAGFRVASPRLPALAEAKVIGVLEEFPELPGLREKPREVARLYNRALGLASGTGESAGWRTAPVVSPLRSRAEHRDPGALLPAIRSDLDRVCELGWISNRGICNSLGKKLEQAARSLDRGRTKTASNQLGAFLRELEAQHGPRPGKHVNDNAFYLLTTNAEVLRDRLPSGAPGAAR